MPAVPKPKKVKKLSLVKQCDHAARTICKSVGICANAGGLNGCKYDKYLEWAHVVGRSAKQIKWDLDNCFCLCRTCHWYFTNNPHKWFEFVVSKTSEEHWLDLHRRSVAYKKIDHKEILAVLQAFAEKHKIEL